MKGFKKSIIFFLLGAILGPLGDHFHMTQGTTGYLHPQSFFMLYDLSWWMFLEFGLATLCIGWFNQIFLGPGGIIDSTQVLMSLLGAVVLLLGADFLAEGIFKNGCLISLALGTWWMFSRDGWVFTVAVLIAMMGWRMETSIISHHVFPGLVTPEIPAWVLALYFIASIHLNLLGEWLSQHEPNSELKY